jgi:hypothetical protein
VHRVLVFDTSVILVWLQVPNKETCGPRNDPWDKARVEGLVEKESRSGSTFVLPVATIIEAGNHISQAPSRRWECAKALMEVLRKCLDEEEPWAAFSHQADLWSAEKLGRLIASWPDQAASGLSLGDATIRDVADFYARSGAQVEILTGDRGLKSYEPAAPVPRPRRRT